MMARPFFGAGFFAPPSADPAAYAALLALFGGDEAALDFYVADTAGFFSDGVEAQAALDALQEFGSPAAALAALAGAPINQSLAFALELAVPLYGVADTIVISGGTFAGAVTQAPTFA
jgi:hypothetical protein